MLDNSGVDGFFASWEKIFCRNLTDLFYFLQNEGNPQYRYALECLKFSAWLVLQNNFQKTQKTLTGLVKGQSQDQKMQGIALE